MTYTPDTLRKWANAMDMPIDGLDCADAWEAERLDRRQQVWGLERDFDAMRHALHDENDALRQRLEAAKEQADVDRSFIEQYQVEVAGLRQRLEAAEEVRFAAQVLVHAQQADADSRRTAWSNLRAALAAGETTHDDYGTTWAAIAAGDNTAKQMKDLEFVAALAAGETP